MRARAAFLVFLALAAAHTWPLVSAPWRHSLNHNADAELNTWTLAWIARTLPRAPTDLFNGNIFAPEPGTLTYTDPLVVPALPVAPLLWLGASPVLAYNLSLLLGLALTGWAAWLCARHWTGSSTAALVAGAVTAFNPHLLTRLPHIVAAWSWTIPLSLFLADRLVDQRRLRTALLLALTVTATAATSLYTLTFVAIVVAAVAAAAALERRWREVVWICGAALGGVMAAAPFLVPYVRFAATGVRRPLESVAQFSATLSGYLASTSRVHAGWSATFFERDVSLFFAGFAAMALGAAGLAVARGAHTRRRRGVLAALMVVGVVLSLGPATSIYRALYEWFPPLSALRAAARFGYLYLCAVALAAAYGVAWLQTRVAAPGARSAIAVAALGLVTIEAWSAPIHTVPFSGVPGIYKRVADAPGQVVLAEMPFWTPDAVFRNGEYVMNATGHWRPLANGYSGFTPMSYRRRADFLWYFPDARALDRLKSEGITHVMVHVRHFPAHERPALEQALRDQTVLTLVAVDTQGRRLYTVN